MKFCFSANMCKNPKQAWAKVNNFLKKRIVSANIDVNVNILNVDIMNRFFTDISTSSHYQWPPYKNSCSNHIKHETGVFNYYDIYKLLSSIKHTVPGPDNLPCWFLWESAAYIAYPLCMMFNQSFKYAIYPSCFKVATIMPIPKTCQPKDFSDFRPILVTSIIAHIFDKMVANDIIYPHLNLPRNRTILCNQYAFRKTSSCECAIMIILDKVTNMLACNNTKVVSIFALDISKTFDSISHQSVLQGIDRMGFPDFFYNWCLSYLDSHKHQTKF